MTPAAAKENLDFVSPVDALRSRTVARSIPVEAMSEAEFGRAIEIEKRRSERSRKAFVLLLADVTSPNLPTGGHQDVLAVLGRSMRETDLLGWYRDKSVIGVVYTEVSAEHGQSVAELLLGRSRRALYESFPFANEVLLTVTAFPQEGINSWLARPAQAEISAEARDLYEPHPFALKVKRAMDIVGSLAALIVTSPLMLAVALAIKATSKGPVLFKQQRVGLRGRTFTFLKFRSMRVDNDPEIHKRYVQQLIASGAAASTDGSKPLYKIANDPRVTRVGRFIRKTSLDELPQFLNVLRGDMSLVGPRPPIPYEVNCYDTWHKRRYLTVNPGLTGLWQVHGRSRTTFDEMVRLDLLYARTWTIWMDIKILLQTPLAVLRGDGAE